MKILVTGAAGFIGYHLSYSLLKDGYDVFGVDNINDYYDAELKYKRLKMLNSISNFSFDKVDICDFNSLSKIYAKYIPDKVVNLAAQAGVRYSFENPRSYIKSNLEGFFNVIELCKMHKIKSLIYASSSSVYGANKKIPFSTEDIINKPISLYAATKASNELIATSYSHLFDLNVTGLRYFTVYGPWGRPDMAMYKFAEKIFNFEEISVYNNGNMKRDFTYIDDIVDGTRAAIDRDFKSEVFNLGNNKSEELMKMIKIIEKELDLKAKINFLPMQKGDVEKTFANIDKSIQKLNYSPKVCIDEGISRFIEWYLDYKNK